MPLVKPCRLQLRQCSCDQKESSISHNRRVRLCEMCPVQSQARVVHFSVRKGDGVWTSSHEYPSPVLTRPDVHRPSISRNRGGRVFSVKRVLTMPSSVLSVGKETAREPSRAKLMIRLGRGEAQTKRITIPGTLSVPTPPALQRLSSQAHELQDRFLVAVCFNRNLKSMTNQVEK